MAQRAGEKSWEAAISGRRWWNLFPKPGFDISVFCNVSMSNRDFSCRPYILRRWGALPRRFRILMARTWVVQRRAGNPGWVDTIRPLLFGPVGAALWPVEGVPSNARERRYRDRQLRTSPLFPPPPA
jgi:hypothetical protein